MKNNVSGADVSCVGEVFSAELFCFVDDKAFQPLARFFVAQGKIDDVLTPERLYDAYDMDVCQWMREMLEQWK